MARLILLTVLWLCVAGCASSTPDTTAAIVTPAAAAGTVGAGYVLSAEEQAWDCKKLTGRMQVYILEIRGGIEGTKASSVSRLMRSAVASTIGGSTAGGDPQQGAKDLAMLQAYNQQLVAKGCKSFNLDEELQPKDITISPRASVPAPGTVKPGKQP